MDLKVATEWYNEKRYGKPYIAVCDSKLNVVAWGTWLGTPGNAGELSISLKQEPTLVMTGQKDFRVLRNSAPKYALFSKGERVTEWTRDRFAASKLLRDAEKSGL